MADEVKPPKVRKHLVDDMGEIWKRWSTWIISLTITAQATWALVPSEAREILPRPEVIGIILGLAALIAAMLKQGKKSNDDEAE